jgi:hypothetical protein
MSYDENRISDQIDGGLSEREELLNELASLKKLYNDLAESHAKQVIEINRLEEECDNYCTVMIAAAEEIKRVWQSHCDDDGYGPQNLLHRLEKGIPAQYGYTAGAFEADENKIKYLESELLKAKERFCQCNENDKTGSTSAMHCNHCGKIEQSETWLK